MRTRTHTHTHTWNVAQTQKIENNKIMAAATTYLDQKIILISEVRQMKTNII